MIGNETYAQVMGIIRSVIDLGPHVDAQTAIEEIEEWDSLAGVNILLSLEETFDVEMSQDDFFEAASIADIIEILEQSVKQG